MEIMVKCIPLLLAVSLTSFSQTNDVVDNDRDGMPDSWEEQWGLDTSRNDAGWDADRDGSTNIQEFIGGTNPVNPQDIPFVSVQHIDFSDEDFLEQITVTENTGISFGIENLGLQDSEALVFRKDEGIDSAEITIQFDARVSAERFVYYLKGLHVEGHTERGAQMFYQSPITNRGAGRLATSDFKQGLADIAQGETQIILNISINSRGTALIVDSLAWETASDEPVANSQQVELVSDVQDNSNLEENVTLYDISKNGRFMVFGTNFKENLYWKDLTTGETKSFVPQDVGYAYDFAKVSEDGRFVFAKYSTRRNANVSGTMLRIDTSDNSVINFDDYIETRTGLTFATSGTSDYDISEDGEIIVLETDINLDDDSGTTVWSRLGLIDFNTGKIEDIGGGADGSEPDDARYNKPILSSDGSKLAFAYSGQSLIPDEDNLGENIYFKDLSSGTVVNVSRDINGNYIEQGRLELRGMDANGENVYLWDEPANLGLYTNVSSSRMMARYNLSSGSTEVLRATGIQDDKIVELANTIMPKADGQYLYRDRSFFDVSGDDLYHALGDRVAVRVDMQNNTEVPILANNRGFNYRQPLMAASNGNVFYVVSDDPHLFLLSDKNPQRYEDPQIFKITLDPTLANNDNEEPVEPGITSHVQGDYTGDGKADVAVRRPSTYWQFVLNSEDSEIQRVQFGRQENDIPVSGDFDGDRIADIAVRRPSNQFWYIVNSSDGEIQRYHFGKQAEDIPVPADYDGDGITDIAVRRPSNHMWYILNSSDGEIQRIQFGRQSEDIPVPADYDGDGKADVAVRRPSNQFWYILNSSDGEIQRIQFGRQVEDIPVPADYDGDGKADVAVRRPSNQFWYILNSSDGEIQRVQFGRQSGDIPIPADYDGDGKADVAVRRPSNHFQYILNSGDGEIQRIQFGRDSGDIPLIAPVTVRMNWASGNNELLSIREEVSGADTLSQEEFPVFRGNEKSSDF